MARSVAVEREQDAFALEELAGLSVGSDRGVWLVLARVVLDVFTIAAAVGLAALLRFGFGLLGVNESDTPTAPHVLASVVWLASLIVIFGVNRLYDEDTLFAGGGELSRLVRSVVEAIAVLSLFVFFTHSFAVSRSWLGLTAIFSIALLAGERMILRAVLTQQRSKGLFRRPVILVSDNLGVQPTWFKRQVGEFDVVAYADPKAIDDYLKSERSGKPINPLSSMKRVGMVVRAGDLPEDALWKLVLHAGQAQIPVFVYSTVRSVGRDRVTVRELDGRTMVKFSPPRLGGLRGIQKRAFDVLGSTLAFILAAPIMLAIGIMILFTSGWPILYSQERVGRGGHIFRIWKFRTMKKNAESQTGAVWAVRDDDRLTRVGKVLRRLSLDELPQLWNVIRGDMSLVGPRPERPAFVGKFSEEVLWYEYRHRIRPGMTGWAQSHGLRGDSGLDSRVEFDNWYIEHWSIPLDVNVILRTVRAVLRGTNAY